MLKTCFHPLEASNVSVKAGSPVAAAPPNAEEASYHAPFAPSLTCSLTSTDAGRSPYLSPSSSQALLTSAFAANRFVKPSMVTLPLTASTNACAADVASAP